MMKKRFAAIILALICVLSMPATARAANVSDVLGDTARIVLAAADDPSVSMEGGDWAVFGLARSGVDVPREYYEKYHQNVVEFVANRKGVLHERKYTEYSRVVIGLTAAGYDPRNVAGHDLTVPLGDFENTIWQGINGPILALLALDCSDYTMPVNQAAQTQATREMYIDEILSRQLVNGGFSLAGGTSAETMNDPADPDTTGMALQALAKYKQNPAVARAINKALACLSEMQDESGGFESWGEANAESVVQVIVALCELEIPLDDARFVKNGNSLQDGLMAYYKKGAGFLHTKDGKTPLRISTEQALYALAAIQRANAGQTSLYCMGDVQLVNRPADAQSNLVGLPNKHKDIQYKPIVAPGKTFADVAGHANRVAIEALAARDIISGKGDGLFAPAATITRAEFAAIVTNGFGIAPAQTNTFTDVPANAWYAGVVGAAHQYGIVGGMSATTFNPTGLLSRAEAAAMITNAAKLCGMDTSISTDAARNILAQFGDYMTVPTWAWPSLAFCYDAGILSMDEFDIQPLANATRGEVAEMLFRMLEAAKLLYNR